MKIFIRDSKNNLDTIYIEDSATVSDIKEIVKKKNSISNDIELICNGMILDDSYKLYELEIREGNTIEYIGVFPAGINI